MAKQSKPKKQPKLNKKVAEEMSTTYETEVSADPFIPGKGGNMPALGYPCAACGSKNTKLRFAESTNEEDSTLRWMELQCRDCEAYTRYTKKEA
jgi:hypothetical protein